MKSYSLALAIFIGVICIFGCMQRRTTTEGGAVIGGMADQHATPSPADKMLRMQDKEKVRQEKDLEDLKRQEYYDEQYRQYLKE